MTKSGIIITGATGFVGGYLVKHLGQNHQIFALDRRLPSPTSGSEAMNVRWFQVDIGHFEALGRVFRQIKAMGGAEFLVHLAGYYDFTGEDHPEYRHTNVIGTRNLLEHSTDLSLKKFIFTSSLAACPFPQPGQTITEETPPLAPTPYGHSKRLGEEMLNEFQASVPTCIVRLAAIFSDWGQYALLDHFLQTWTSPRWNRRLLAGRGQSAVPYLHVQDLLTFYDRVIEKSDALTPLEVLQASPDGCTTHLELFQEVTRCFYGTPRTPICIPKRLAGVGLRLREQLGRLTGDMPFERAWMQAYIDLQLNIDASRTRHRLDWSPSPELHILRRLPLMIDTMRHHPEKWRRQQG